MAEQNEQQSILDKVGLAYLWAELKKKFAPITHNHAASDISSGTLSSSRLPTVPVTKGGTGATSAAAARTNLGITPANIGAATSGHTHDNATTSSAGLMSASDKSKLDGVAAGANKYSHPEYTAKGNGFYKVTVDGTGHISGTAAVQKSDITGLGIPAQDTTYGAMTGATSSAAGKSGLVPAPAAGKQSSFLKGDGTWAVPTNTTYSAATQSAAGLMSAADKQKLDGIASGANKTTVDSAMSETSTNPVQNKVVNSALAAIRVAFLPLTGGTLEGQLELKPYDNGYSRLFKNHSATADYGTVLQDTDKNGNTVKITLQASDGTFYFVDKNGNIYKVYGQHSKPTPAEIGALPTTGGDLTGALSVKNELVIKDDDVGAEGKVGHYGEGEVILSISDRNSNKIRYLSVCDNTRAANISGGLYLTENVDGTFTSYSVYGDHNKPTPAAIGAAPADVYKYFTSSATSSYGWHISNALLIDTTNPLGVNNRPGYVNSETGSLPSGFSHGIREVLYYGNEWIIVKITGWDLYGKPCSARREYRGSNGGWLEWEWVNPPLVSATEYRTTKRYNGKVVYTKRMSVGALPNNAQAGWAHGVASPQNIISVFGRFKDGGDNILNDLRSQANSTHFVWQNHVYVQAKADLSGWSGEFVLEYVKE